MNHIRVHGNPFAEDVAASQLRNFLRLCVESGMRCSLSLAGLAVRPGEEGESVVALTDGVRDLRVPTRLPAAELDVLMRAARDVVAATAPIVVFAASHELDLAQRLVGFEWPLATAVIGVGEGATAGELLGRVRAELRWAGTESPQHAVAERELRHWLALPPPVPGGVIVHVGSTRPADGTDLVLDAWRAGLATSGHRLRIVLNDSGADTKEVDCAALAAELSSCAGDCEIVQGPFHVDHVRDAAVILLPWRTMRSPAVLVLAMASGRPVCVSRFQGTAAIVGAHGVCVPIGGRRVSPGDPGSRFEPYREGLAAAARLALGDGGAAIGQRARRHVELHHGQDRPSPAPTRSFCGAAKKPLVVLEAPFFETSSSAELSIETAKALLARGNVELQLVATAPFRGDLLGFRRRAPELESLLVRQPSRKGLWLSSGWPVRVERPDCEKFALRVDWEYGALPMELTPHVTEEACAVVVHSEHVCRTLVAAGRSRETIIVVPHGTDSAMHEGATPDAEILRWKQGRPAVLFCGGLVWRKGFDVFLRTVLAARAAGADFVVVVKSNGQDSHYAQFHLRELVERFVRTKGTPPLLLVERDMSRESLAGLYAACDVMLHPYRGEGFCMPVLEARAVGLPVLATGGGATDAIMTGPGATQIPSERRDIELPGAHVGTPWVLEPCAEASARLLLETLADLPARRAEARAFAPTMRSAFSWSRAAESIERLANVVPVVTEHRIVALPATEPRARKQVAVPLAH